MRKKGDAAMVAMVLLIVSAIVIGVLVSTFSKETEEKVEKKIISMGSAVECEDVRVGIAELSDGINITNKGTLGIDKIAMRKYASGGTVTTLRIGNVEDVNKYWNQDFNGNNKLDPGIYEGKVEFFVYTESNLFTNFNKIEFIPIIIVDDDEIGCQNKIVTWEA